MRADPPGSHGWAQTLVDLGVNLLNHSSGISANLSHFQRHDSVSFSVRDACPLWAAEQGGTRPPPQSFAWGGTVPPQ